MIKQNYVIYQQSKQHSRHGGMITKLLAIGVRDRKDYVTYIDPTNYNYQQWQPLVQNPTAGYLLGHMRVKNQDKCILNADSQFKVLAVTATPDVLLYELHDIWKEQDEAPAPNHFRELFEDV